MANSSSLPGGVSNYYFDGRMVTLDPEGAYLVARAVLPILRDCRAEAIAGADARG